VSDALGEFQRSYAAAIARASSRGKPARWGLSGDEFAAALYQSVESFARSSGGGVDVEKYLDSLRAEDLALAVACRRGSVPAWEHFVERFNPVLQSAARAIARDDMIGRELADSLYAELFGLDVRAGRRRSLLDYFGGRSSLGTWLRAVVAQRHVDYLRAQRMTEPLEGASEVATDDPPPEPVRTRYLQLVGGALHAALRSLDARDRLRLAYYYRDGLKLREIARLMHDHESTVSRNLERTRNAIRARVERALRHDGGLSDEQIRLCYDLAAEELSIDFAVVAAKQR
jgi:RNA polymerase sigma-70 factor (ECF subfamily)